MGFTFGTFRSKYDRTNWLPVFTSTKDADPLINSAYLSDLQSQCPSGGDGLKRVALDKGSSTTFDATFFSNVRDGNAALDSDQRYLYLVCLIYFSAFLSLRYHGQWVFKGYITSHGKLKIICCLLLFIKVRLYRKYLRLYALLCIFYFTMHLIHTNFISLTWLCNFGVV